MDAIGDEDQEWEYEYDENETEVGLSDDEMRPYGLD
jgi:hypothetical protein